MDFNVTDIPLNRHQRYNASTKGKARNKRYRDETRRDYRSEESERKYLNKRFRAWDGEGGNEDDGSHTYFLLASSDGHRLKRRTGLRTSDVFDLWLGAGGDPDNPGDSCTNIIFGGNYDFNMVLKDLDLASLKTLYETGQCKWQTYWIEWRAGKSFRIWQWQNGVKRSFLIYDILPFFQRPFVQACDEYLGESWPDREEIIAGKARRGTFDWSQIDEVETYNGSELSTLVALANELRTRLHNAGIRVSRWDGPGAIASAVFQKQQIKSYFGPVPESVSVAARTAYAGGRFEILRKGHHLGSVFEYDIRSAYPSAIRHLPCLAHGYWVHRENDPRRRYSRKPVRFGLYRIEADNLIPDNGDGPTGPSPLWMRDRNGSVIFSPRVHGWYWSPEAALVWDIPGVTVHEEWEFVPECDHQPFGYVEAMYNKRAALKKAGDGAHVGLKLALNSMYGKLAQQIGAEKNDDGTWRLPPYHCLEWAGWITSHCRAQVYRAAQLAPDSVIAFETDALFSLAPLPLATGSRLGEWDEVVFSSLTYFKSGMYYGTKIRENGKDLPEPEEVEKSRGINKGTVTRQDVIDALAREWDEYDPVIEAEQTRFIGLGAAMNTDMNKWRRWITSPRNLKVHLEGKRIDVPYDIFMARGFIDAPPAGMRQTWPRDPSVEFSQPYEVMWVDGSEFDTLPARALRFEQAHEVDGDG